MDSPDRIASIIAEDRKEDDEVPIEGGIERRRSGGSNAKMGRSMPTPIMLPDIKTLSSKGKVTKGIKLNIKTLSKEQLKARDTTFMDSTYHDGNANISQRNRHKNGKTGRNIFRDKDIEQPSHLSRFLLRKSFLGTSKGRGGEVWELAADQGGSKIFHQTSLLALQTQIHLQALL